MTTNKITPITPQRISGSTASALARGHVGAVFNPCSILAIILGDVGLNKTSTDPSLLAKAWLLPAVLLAS